MLTGLLRWVLVPFAGEIDVHVWKNGIVRCAEKARSVSREWQAKNPERHAKYHAEYYISRREELLERQSKWHKNNPGRYKEYYKANPEVLLASRDRRRTRVRVEMAAEDRRLSVKYRKQIKDDPCYWCGTDEGPKHFDHLVPLAKGGTDHWWNLVRSCATCNLRKHDKMPGEWLEVLRREGVARDN